VDGLHTCSRVSIILLKMGEEHYIRLSFGDWQDPKALRSRKEAMREIAAGALNEGRKCGISGRSGTYHSGAREESPSAADFEVALVKPSPDLGLLLFTDTPRESSWVSTPPRSRETSWASVQPRSYVDWVYRNTPGHQQSQSIWETTSAATPRCATSRRPLGPISEASASQCKNGRTASASSTRAPSRATQASLEACSRGPSRATQVSPEVGVSRGPSRASQASPGFPSIEELPEVVLRTSSPGDCSRSPSPGTHRSPTPSVEARGRAAVPSDWATSVESDPIAALPVAEQLDAAARAAGERVRGSVAMAMRAHMICRNAASVASRRLLHLYGDPTYPPPSFSSCPDQAGSSPATSSNAKGEKLARSGTGPNFQAILDHRDCVPPHHVPQPHSQDWIYKKKRVIKVARNTALGRMVRSDPDRARRHDLVAVPAWTRNRPWPPPPIKIVKKMAVLTNEEEDKESAEENSVQKASFRQKLQSDKASLKDSIEEVSGNRSPKAKIKAVTLMMSQVKKPSQKSGAPSPASPQRKLSHSSEGDSSRVGTVDSLQPIAEAKRTTSSHGSPADLELATTLLGRAETESLTKLFYHCVQPGRHVLNRQGMIKALREAGYTPDTKDEQRCFAAVQEQVLDHSRGKDNDPLTNPMLNAQGHWELREFILMLQALHEIGARQARLNNKQIADEFGMTITEVEELRLVFEGYDEKGSGSIGSSELKALVQEAEFGTEMLEEDFSMLLESVNLEAVEFFDFRQILTIVVQLSRLVKTQVHQPTYATSHGSMAPARRHGSAAGAGRHASAISGWATARASMVRQTSSRKPSNQ